MHAIKKASYPITGSPHRHPELQAMVDTSCTLQSIESFMLMGTPYSKPFFACFFTCCNWDSLFSRKSVRQLTSLCTFKACGKQEKSVISTQDIPPNEPCLESFFVVQPELKTLSLLLEKFNLSKKVVLISTDQGYKMVQWLWLKDHTRSAQLIFVWSSTARKLFW